MSFNHKVKIIIVIFGLILGGCTNDRNDGVDQAKIEYNARLANNAAQPGTIEYCIEHAERVGTFYDGIKHFGSVSPNMPPEYRDCLEDKVKRKAALKEYNRLMAELEGRRQARNATERKQKKLDKDLVNSIQEQK